MSTLHKVKAYFGMAPMDDYDDEYYDDEDRSSRAYPRRGREDRFEDDGYARAADGRRASGLPRRLRRRTELPSAG
jgi:cell division inhibitor SepF